MDLKALKKAYNNCSPDEVLPPDDPRNVDLDRNDATGPGQLVRGAQWARRLGRQIELSGDTPVLKYFTGLRGSGKSTELLRLAERLRSKKGANIFTIYVDALDTMDLSSEIDIPDIMTILLYESERQILIEEKQDPANALKNGYITQIWKSVRATDIELNALNFDVVAVGMKNRSDLRARVRNAVAAQLSSFLRDVRGGFVKLNARACALGYSGLIVVFDSLEKLQGISTTWRDVLKSAERVFATGAPHLRLPVHVLYTVPPALAFQAKVDVQYLPMIKLRSRDRRSFKQGLDAARSIIEKRVSSAILKERLGSTSAEPRIRRLIEWSGGYLRDILRLLQSLLEIEDIPVSNERFEDILNRAGDNYRRFVLTSGRIDLLAQVAVDQDLILESDADREAADRLLSNSVVMRYTNKEDWYELHPAVRNLKPVKDAIKRLKAARAKRGR